MRLIIDIYYNKYRIDTHQIITKPHQRQPITLALDITSAIETLPILATGPAPKKEPPKNRPTKNPHETYN